MAVKGLTYTFLRGQHLKNEPQNSTECQLHRYLSGIEAQLPQDGKTFLFERGSFPALPKSLRTASIDICKTYQFINDSCRVDVLNFMASRKTYRHLGLAILAVVFQPDLTEMSLELTSQTTQINALVFRYAGTTPRTVFTYLTVPYSFEYQPKDIDEHPWMGRHIRDDAWPDFLLTYSGTDAHNHWEDRDVVQGFGNDDASVMLADLLLDFGRDENKQLMVRLETIFSPAYRAVSRLSPEVRLHLPGSDSWPG
jgi:hypothetical protein